MIISLTGDLGAGKSTLAKMLAKELDFPHYYMGQIRRDCAKKRGMTIEEYNKFGEENPETDYEVDEYQKHLGETRDNFIVEGRTSWFLIPHALKVYVAVDPLEGARRIFGALQKDNKRNEGEGIQTVGDMVKANEERMRSDHFRYMKYYGKDCFDHGNFDYILDTTDLSIEDSFQDLLTYVHEEQKKES